jgi:hypothetical protein
VSQLTILTIELITGLVIFTYCSFFEWFVHRYIMHEKHFPLHDAFRGHTVVHHQIYRWDKSFESQVPGRPQHVALRWYAFPGMLLPHAVLFGAVQGLAHIPIFWGGTIACILYFTGYEYTHYLMHVPKGHYVERFKWFRFIKEHHRLHHKYYLRNLNVFIPLGDVCLGTLVTAEGWRSKQAKRGRNLAERSGGAEKKPTVPVKSEG